MTDQPEPVPTSPPTGGVQPYAPYVTYAPTLPPRRRRRWWVAAVLIVLAVLLISSGIVALLLADELSGLLPAHNTALRAAYESCGNVGDLSDGDTTLFLDMIGTDAGSGTLNQSDVICVLAKLDTPSYVIREMDQTRALDGRLSQSWGRFEASWSYHPDDGLDVLIREH